MESDYKEWKTKPISRLPLSKADQSTNSTIILHKEVNIYAALNRQNIANSCRELIWGKKSQMLNYCNLYIGIVRTRNDWAFKLLIKIYYTRFQSNLPLAAEYCCSLFLSLRKFTYPVYFELRYSESTWSFKQNHIKTT